MVFRSAIILLTYFGILGIFGGHLQAQQVQIQQPVVATTSVQTTASVPDRGGIKLGGVNSAEAGRRSTGVFRSGTSTGYSVSSTSMTAHVRIIDLREMDEAILAGAPTTETSRVERSSYGRQMIVHKDEPTSPRPPEETPAQKVAKFETLAVKAEAAGKTGVAKLHWQMAAKYGSVRAKSKLEAGDSFSKTVATKHDVTDADR